MTAILLLSVLISDYTPTSEYTKTEVQGFPVYIHPTLQARADDRDKMVAMLDAKLAEVQKILPREASEKLKTTKIWLDWESKSCPAAVYHPSAVWLSQHKFNPDMEKSVELGNVNNVLNWTKQSQPYMVLHELAHAYHHQHIGYDNKEVLAAFEAAKTAKIYEDVKHVNGGKVKHYALSNVQEFFAEATEAYFGKNDMQPFDRKELQEFDPLTYRMLERVWGVKAKVKG